MADSVIQLKCDCKSDPWGKKGKQSLAAQLCSKTPGTDFKLDDGKEYSEMWMGTYPTTPSLVLSSGRDLQDVLDENKEKLIGKTVLDKFGSKLPFLPKILSIAKALPLQIHPDKDLAARLHKKDPEKFGDGNHKPEIAVALSKFETFVGWKPIGDIGPLFDKLEPLRQFLPAGASQSSKFNDETLKSVVRNILEADDRTVAKVQDDLGKLKKEDLGEQGYMVDLLPRLQEQYSKQDPGNLVALLTMNFLVLQPGDSIYVPADGIHAYLSGDIVECMARSDNVINTGFCPRADRDSAELFTSAVKESPHSPQQAILKPHSSNKGKQGKTQVYDPPMSEFALLATILTGGEKEEIDPIKGPSILFVTEGDGKMEVEGKTHDLKEGYVFFVGQGVGMAIASVNSSLKVYRAYAE